mmetsp:Transcript_103472/g.301889  ORF Transcript_103472/g.301889 Transcript_103472/m.301889 type:complete len:298 (+) Transcript_103472:1010-1903(+)
MAALVQAQDGTTVSPSHQVIYTCHYDDKIKGAAPTQETQYALALQRTKVADALGLHICKELLSTGCTEPTSHDFSEDASIPQMVHQSPRIRISTRVTNGQAVTVNKNSARLLTTWHASRRRHCEQGNTGWQVCRLGSKKTIQQMLGSSIGTVPSTETMLRVFMLPCVAHTRLSLNQLAMEWRDVRARLCPHQALFGTHSWDEAPLSSPEVPIFTRRQPERITSVKTCHVAKDREASQLVHGVLPTPTQKIKLHPWILPRSHRQLLVGLLHGRRSIRFQPQICWRLKNREVKAMGMKR